MIRFFFVMALFFGPLSASEKLKHADNLFQATLFEQSAKEYQTLLDQAQDDALALKIGSRLIENQALLKNYKAALQVAHNRDFYTPLKVQELEPERLRALYFLGLCHHHLGQQDEAIRTFEAYLQSSQDCKHEDCDHVRLELGLIHFHQQHAAQACKVLKAVSYKKPQIYYQAQAYLAKISLNEESPEKALTILQNLDKAMPQGEPLRDELAFLLGETYGRLEDFQRAAVWLEKAYAKRDSSWNAECLYKLGWAHLHLKQYNKAEEAFSELMQQPKWKEIALLSLAQCYLKDSDKQKAENVLAQCRESAALLLKARLAPSYQEREKIYAEVTKSRFQGTSDFALGWYERGLNAFREGLAGNKTALSRASQAFEEAFPLSPKERKAIILKLNVDALCRLGDPSACAKALALLQQNQDLLDLISDPEELYYVYGLALFHLACEKRLPWDIAFQSLQDILKKFPDGKRRAAIQLLNAQIFYHQKQLAEAEKLFLNLTEDPESYLWAAKCAEEMGNKEKSQLYRRKIFDEHSDAPCAAESYFTYYSYRDYVQGDRAAVKHLQAMQTRFPQSPYLVTAFYLIGMDEKRDRKSAEGKWIRKKNLNASIDALQAAESLFDQLDQNKQIPESERPFFLKVRYRATLERSLANLAIAEESQGAKKRIFLQYAAEVLEKIRNDLKVEPCEALLEESSYWLAQAHIKLEEDSLAEPLLRDMIAESDLAQISAGYFLSRAWCELALIQMRQEQYKQALHSLAKSEEASRPQYISADQKIDLWIQQSLCYRALGNLDQAMLILSNAINDDTISSQRVKAMYLRAEIYELQGRFDLARKQLEATAKKGGEWAQKAKKRLSYD